MTATTTNPTAPVDRLPTVPAGSFAGFLAALAERQADRRARAAEVRRQLAGQVRRPGVVVRRG